MACSSRQFSPSPQCHSRKRMSEAPWVLRAEAVQVCANPGCQATAIELVGEIEQLRGTSKSVSNGNGLDTLQKFRKASST